MRKCNILLEQINIKLEALNLALDKTLANINESYNLSTQYVFQII